LNHISNDRPRYDLVRDIEAERRVKPYRDAHGHALYAIVEHNPGEMDRVLATKVRNPFAREIVDALNERETQRRFFGNALDPVRD
jgi:hypothetical protein